MRHSLLIHFLSRCKNVCRHGGTIRCLKLLLKAKLVHHENVAYDGYRLTYLGYDYLAIKTLFKRGRISSVGPQIGVGKEADVFEVRAHLSHHTLILLICHMHTERALPCPSTLVSACFYLVHVQCQTYIVHISVWPKPTEHSSKRCKCRKDWPLGLPAGEK